MRKWCLTLEKIAANKPFEQKLSVLGKKSFVMCSDDGYPCFIEPYCGSKKSGQNKASKSLFAHSLSPVYLRYTIVVIKKHHLTIGFAPYLL